MSSNKPLGGQFNPSPPILFSLAFGGLLTRPSSGPSPNMQTKGTKNVQRWHQFNLESGKQWPKTNHHTTTLNNCFGFFQGAFNALPWHYFCEPTSIWHGQVETCHGKKNWWNEMVPKIQKFLNSLRFLEWLDCKVSYLSSNFT